MTPKDTADLDKKIAARDASLTKIFNDPANRKFDRIWMAESDIADDFVQAVNWYKNWTEKRDGFAAANDAPRAQSCESMVEWWDERLVKIVSKLARLDAAVSAKTDAVAQEFVKNRDAYSLLTEVRDVLSVLDDTQIKSGKAVYEALLPLMEAPQPQTAPKPAPQDKGNPFKKGPSA